MGKKNPNSSTAKVHVHLIFNTFFMSKVNTMALMEDMMGNNSAAGPQFKTGSHTIDPVGTNYCAFQIIIMASNETLLL